MLICLASVGSFAQEESTEAFVKPGFMRAFGCFAFDYRIHQNVWDYRLHGFLEYFPEERISLMGEVYKYLDSGEDFPVIENNFSVGTGLGYHWPKKRLDPYVYFMAIGNFYDSQVMTETDGVISDKDVSVTSIKGNPGAAVGGGLNFYVWKYLNFFVQVRYHHTFIYSPIQIRKMNAFSVSYGLGFNFQTKKK